MQPHTAVNGPKDPKVLPVNAPDAQPGARRRNPSAVQLLEQPAIYRGSSLWCAAAFSLLQSSNQHIYTQNAKSASIVSQHRAVGRLADRVQMNRNVDGVPDASLDRERRQNFKCILAGPAVWRSTGHGLLWCSYDRPCFHVRFA